MLAFGLSFTFTSCDDDDDLDDNPIDDELELEVEDQVISRNMIMVEFAEVPADGWIVVHKDNNGSPVVPDIISEPVQIMEGETDNVMVPLDTMTSLMDGEQLWVMLHEDTGNEGEYEFDGSGTPDQPFTDGGDIVMKSIMISSPMIDAGNASYDAGSNTVTIPSVEAAVDGWLVIHNEDANGNIVLPGIIGKTMVDAGTSTDVEIQLDQGVNITSGQNLFPMLHIDNGDIGTYEFDGSPNTNDPPEVFGNEAFPNNVIFTSFMVQ